MWVNTRRIQKEYRAAGKDRSGSERVRRRQLENEVSAGEDGGFRPRELVRYRDVAPLDEISAHHAYDVRAGQDFFCFGYMAHVTRVKRVVFGGYSDCHFNILLNAFLIF
jgi:hypothetical protein